MIAPRLTDSKPCPHCGRWLPRDKHTSIPRPLPGEVIGPMLRLYGYQQDDLYSKRKDDWQLNRVRVKVYRALQDHGYSSLEIGRLTHRDHSTILYHLRKPL